MKLYLKKLIKYKRNIICFRSTLMQLVDLKGFYTNLFDYMPRVLLLRL